MPPPTPPPTFTLSADDVFAIFALIHYRGRVGVAHPDRAYQRYIEDVLDDFREWQRNNKDDVGIPEPPS